MCSVHAADFSLAIPLHLGSGGPLMKSHTRFLVATGVALALGMGLPLVAQA